MTDVYDAGSEASTVASSTSSGGRPRTSFWRIAHETLRDHLGRRYLLVGAACLALIFWPLIAFASRIQFDPAAFTQEWLLTGTTALMLYLILEIVRRRSNAAEQDRAISRSLREAILPRLHKLQMIVAGVDSAGSGRYGQSTLNVVRDLLDAAADASALGAARRSQFIEARHMLNDVRVCALLARSLDLPQSVLTPQERDELGQALQRVGDELISPSSQWRRQ